MLRRLVPFALGIVMIGSVALADTGERKDLQLFNDVSKAVTHYAQFTVFDNVDVAVKDGTVTLSGDVTMPYKREDIEKRVAKVDGVRGVRNQIKVLPVSPSDDQLRYRIARAIYNDPNFWNYAIGPNPPIHIIVNNGNVTLEGVVATEADKNIANIQAKGVPGAFAVTNNLRVEK